MISWRKIIMPQPPRRDRVYLDANFLIAYFVPGHSDYQGAVRLFARLLSRKNKLYISPLAVDETWHGMVRQMKTQIGSTQPHAAFYSQLKTVLDQILASDDIEIVQFENDLEEGIKQALENLHRYTLKPRDAFHLAIMMDLDIKFIATNDPSFIRLPPEAQTKALSF